LEQSFRVKKESMKLGGFEEGRKVSQEFSIFGPCRPAPKMLRERLFWTRGRSIFEDGRRKTAAALLHCDANYQADDAVQHA